MLMYLLPGIVLLGIITSYEDIKYGKIRNRWVLAGLVYGIVLNLGFIVYYALNGALNLNFAIDFGSNMVIAAVFAIVLWLNHMWSAGDAKLFIAYAVLIPVSVYNYDYIRFFPSFVLFVNAIIPFFVYLLFYSLMFGSWQNRLRYLVNAVKYRLPMVFVSLVGVGGVFQILNSRFFGVENPFMFMVLILLFFIVLDFVSQKVLAVFGLPEKYSFVFFALLIITRLIIDFEIIFQYAFIANIFGISLLYSFLRGYFSEAAKGRLLRDRGIDRLNEGDMLAEGVFYENNKYIKRKLSFGKALDSESGLVPGFDEPLSADNVKKIKNLYRQDKLKFNSIMVQKTVPFAHIMFFGVVITLLANGTLLQFFR